MCYLLIHFRLATNIKMQIYANFRDGHTGVQSLVTLSMNTLGSGLRVFTTLASPNGFDASAMFLIGCSFACNLIMACQCIAYSKRTATLFKEQLKVKAAAKAKKAA